MCDEQAILSGLTPKLHAEVVGHVLKRTLGRLPLFKRLATDFQVAVFPLLKPLSFGAGEVLFKKGAASKELFFLLEGEVNILSQLDGVTPVVRLHAVKSSRTRVEHTMLSQSDGTEIATISVEGCFGQSVLLGHRRPATYVAHTHCELLTIDKSDLRRLFAADPLSASRICKTVLRDHNKSEKTRDLAVFLRLATMPRGEERSAFLCQRAWRRYCDRMAMRHDDVYRMIRESIAPKKAHDSFGQASGHPGVPDDDHPSQADEPLLRMQYEPSLRRAHATPLHAAPRELFGRSSSPPHHSPPSATCGSSGGTSHRTYTGGTSHRTHSAAASLEAKLERGLGEIREVKMSIKSLEQKLDRVLQLHEGGSR